MSAEKNVKLSICTPVYNNCKFTERYLQDLIKLPRDHEIIIVDNGSTDDTESIINKYIQNRTDDQPEIIYLKNNENTGFARASNQAYNISRSARVLFLNNDIYVKSDHSTWTQNLIKYCDDYIVGPTGGMLDQYCNFIRETNQFDTCSLFYMSGWCLASSKKNFEKLKQYQIDIPFPTQLGTAYFEDGMLSLNAMKAKIPFKLQSVPVHHFGRMTSSKMNISRMYNEAKSNFIKEVGKEIKDGIFKKESL